MLWGLVAKAANHRCRVKSREEVNVTGRNVITRYRRRGYVGEQREQETVI